MGALLKLPFFTTNEKKKFFANLCLTFHNMPFLSNHLSRHEGVIGVYLELNKDLQPAIHIRYADPMTEEKLWELMTMETWTITYKKDDVREEGAKISFKTPGVSYEYID